MTGEVAFYSEMQKKSFAKSYDEWMKILDDVEDCLDDAACSDAEAKTKYDVIAA